MNEQEIPCTVSIRRNADKVVRDYRTNFFRDLPEYDGTYIWQDGNFACDCNRRLFFARAANEPEDWESGCSDGEFTILKITLDTGEVVYEEEA